MKILYDDEIKKQINIKFLRALFIFKSAACLGAPAISVLFTPAMSAISMLFTPAMSAISVLFTPAI